MRSHEGGGGGVEILVGPERGEHAAGERRVGGERCVHREVVHGVVGGGEHLDAEALEQGARAVRGVAESSGDLVVDGVGRLGRGLDVDVEERGELVRQPVARCGAGVEVPMARERAPGLARVGGPAAADAEGREVDACGVQQARDVVVVRDEQVGRVGERLVIEQQRRGDVAVRGDDRQLRHRFVQPPGDVAGGRIGGEQPVGIEMQLH